MAQSVTVVTHSGYLKDMYAQVSRVSRYKSRKFVIPGIFLRNNFVGPVTEKQLLVTTSKMKAASVLNYSINLFNKHT